MRDEHLVLLDLHSGKYFALNPTDASALCSDCETGASGDSPSDSKALRVLLERGVLTKNSALGKSFSSPAVEPVTKALIDIHMAERIPIQTRAVWQFATSALIAAVSLRWIPLKRITARLTARKTRRAHISQPQDVRRLKQLVVLFDRLRPFAFSKADACMLYSFALLEFLARHDVYADWVFGVQLGPFRAHCWLQHGPVLLNDTLNHVENLTPIMVI
jgi:Transglutaminase-like superfamily